MVDLEVGGTEVVGDVGTHPTEEEEEGEGEGTGNDTAVVQLSSVKDYPLVQEKMSL